MKKPKNFKELINPDFKENTFNEAKQQAKSTVKVYFEMIKAFWARQPLKYKVKYILQLFLISWAWGIFAEIWYMFSHMIDEEIEFTFHPLICIVRIFTCGFDSFTFGLISLVICYLLYKLWLFSNHRFDYNTEIIYRNGKKIRMVIDDGTHSTDRELTMDEISEKFVHTYTPEQEDTIIFGRNIKDRRVVCSPHFNNGDERNVAIFGGAGSGKTTCFIYPAISQIAKAGENIVAVDPSGQVFATKYWELKNEGYEVYTINTISPEYSNGWNFVGEMGLDYSFCQMCAVTILNNTNTGNGVVQFWEDGMDNLLAALILYVNYLGKGSNTIKEIAQNYVAKKNLEEMTAMFNLLDDESPAKQAYQLFLKDAKLAGNVLQNLGYRLRIFLEPERATLCSTDDLHITDLADPDRKIAIFIITDETDHTYQLIPALFFDMLYKRIANIGKKNENVVGGSSFMQKAIHCFVDEFLTIGKIQDMGGKLSGGRKYNIIWYLVIQSMAQFTRPDKYNEKEAEEILSNCRFQLCLDAQDTTAQYFSDKSGTMTALMYQNTLSSILMRTVSNARSTEIERPVFTKGEISTLGHNGHYMILFTKGTYCVQLEKYYYKESEDYKKLSTKEKYYHISNYKSTMYNIVMKIRERQQQQNKTFSKLTNNYNDSNKTEEKKSTLGSKLLNRHKNLQENSLYEKDGTPRFPEAELIDDEQGNEQISILEENKQQTLEEINKIPPISRIKWNPIIRNYDGLIYRDNNGVVKFIRNNKAVYLLFFKSYASCLDGILPKVQLRCSNEPLDLAAITQKLGNFSNEYYIDYWTAVYHKNDNRKEKWGIGVTQFMPQRHITLVPHLDLIENRKDLNLFNLVNETSSENTESETNQDKIGTETEVTKTKDDNNSSNNKQTEKADIPINF